MTKDNVIPIGGRSVKETLDQFSQEDFECVMLIGIHKDGTQCLQTSKCNAFQKAFMVAFAQSYMNRWFSPWEGE